jgi:apolipoprotein N-acyltransferase
MLKLVRLPFLAALSGILLTISWPEIGWSPIVFIAWIPLLIATEHLNPDGKSTRKLQVFALSAFCFLIWNVGTTWWIVNASLEGALLAFVANSLLMAGVFTISYSLRKLVPPQRSLFILPVFWLSFELIHHTWQLSWPWLTLGNVFANQYQLIQWYEFTGTSGGSLWILLVNISIFNTLKTKVFLTEKTVILKAVRNPLLGILIPALLSLFMYINHKKDKGKQIHVSIIQPNIDPYTEKFDPSSTDQQLETFLELAKTVTDTNTDWLIGPETALVSSMNEQSINDEPRVKLLKSYCSNYPKLNLLIGAETHEFYFSEQTRTGTARKTGDESVFYDSYNTALLINGKTLGLYHKSKLVPGVEQMPFPELFKLVESYAIDLGGTSGTLGTQTERTVFCGINPDQKAAPSICYESVYGDFMRSYIAKGANFIAIITNDGWWGETPGYKQHLAYARLRAIENRRSIVRSANTGVSCIINQRGDIVKSLPYWQKGALAGSIALNNNLTIFSITGDLLGRTASILSLGLLVLYLVKRIKNRFS